MDSGVPRPEAVAISAAVKYALDSSNYARIYGTVSIDALNTFLDRIPE